MASCQTKIKTPSGTMRCGGLLYRCTKCGKAGCTNQKCPNYKGSTSCSQCGYCGGKLERIK